MFGIPPAFLLLLLLLLHRILLGLARVGAFLPFRCLPCLALVTQGCAVLGFLLLLLSHADDDRFSRVCVSDGGVRFFAP